jgi:hypothetical protein
VRRATAAATKITKGHKDQEEIKVGFVLFVNFVIVVPLPSAVSAYGATD